MDQGASRFAESERLFSEALTLIPGGATKARIPTAFTDGPWPIYTKKVKGCHFWDVDGNKYIDYLCAFGPIVLGYCNSKVDRAVVREIKKGFIANLCFPIQHELAKKLIEIIPCAERVYFTKTGSAACTLAVRIARAYSGKDRIVRWGYHGWHDWCLGKKGLGKVLGQRKGPYLESTGVPKQVSELTKTFEYDNLISLEKTLEENRGEIACIIMQPLEFEEPRAGFLEGVRELANKHKAVLIFDEIRTWPRMGLGGAQERFGVTPDITTLSKGIANGYPISAIVGKAEVMDTDVFFSGTYLVSTFEMVAALVTIRELENWGLEHIWRMGARFTDGLQRIVKKTGTGVRVVGVPSMPYLLFDSGDSKFDAEMKRSFYLDLVQRGVFLHPNTHWFLSTAHTPKIVDRSLDKIEQSLVSVWERNR
jgi:glutamate-1-semialdehyde aminotransferase